MSNMLLGITSGQLRRAIVIKQKIETLEQKLKKLLGDSADGGSKYGNRMGGRRTMSPAAKARIIAAQKKRWAKWRKQQGK